MSEPRTEAGRALVMTMSAVVGEIRRLRAAAPPDPLPAEALLREAADIVRSLLDDFDGGGCWCFPEPDDAALKADQRARQFLARLSERSATAGEGTE